MQYSAKVFGSLKIENAFYGLIYCSISTFALLYIKGHSDKILTKKLHEENIKKER
jgi:hypothetical protein